MNRIGVSLAIGFVMACDACGGSGGRAHPSATLSSTTDAAMAFAPIRHAWGTQTKAGREHLRVPLERFFVQFPNDGAMPLARAYYVFVLLDSGELARANSFLRAVELSTGEGSTRDLATIGRAKLSRLLGDPETAFEKLRPLVGKIVDVPTRVLFQEEVSLSAIEAHRDYEAIAYMDAWLRGATEEDKDAVQTAVTRAVAKLPEQVLTGSLRAMRARGAQSGYGREIQRVVAARLAQIALDRGDADLARWLANPESGTSELAGTNEAQLGELATSRRGVTSVEGRMIGLLLPTGSNDLRDEAADVMRGVAWALELPRRDSDAADGAKLSTRDDGGDPERIPQTMAELAGEGAAVVLAALDPRSADRAVKWGEEHAVPVIVLAQPATEHAREYGFVLGESRQSELAALRAALASRAVGAVAPVVTADGDPLLASMATAGLTLTASTACDVDPAHAGEARFPIARWRAANIHAWLVDGPTECARDLIRELATARTSGIVALTLDAAGTNARAPGLRLLSPSTGDVPVVVDKPESIADPDLRKYVAHEGARPSFWTALGRDAAALARRAVASLPLDASGDASEVARRRAIVKNALLDAQVNLWTADTDGMKGQHAIARTLQVVELTSSTRLLPR